jgi:hypothetical protein
MSKFKADLQIKKQSRHEKAALLSKQMKIDFDSFELKVSAWIPVAKVNKPYPKLAITIDSAPKDIRLISGDINDFIVFFQEMAEWMQENRNFLEKTLQREQDKWHALHDAYRSANEDLRKSKLKKVD